MSSTEETRAQEAISRCFDEVVAPMATRMKAQNREAFPLAPDAAQPSYFLPRPQPRMTREEFLAPSCLDLEEFESSLAEHWKALGRTELLQSASRFREIAEAARKARVLAQQSPELSPDIYVMF